MNRTNEPYNSSLITGKPERLRRSTQPITRSVVVRKLAFRTVSGWIRSQFLTSDDLRQCASIFRSARSQLLGVG
jgi:hypothetical protein